jgi:large conductance mechanosensitive channel
MGMLQEFKAFAIRGNVIDLAIGVVIGGAFGKIVSSLVDDIITPAILTPALKAANLADLSKLVIPGTAIKWGNFVSTLISFLIIAFVLFLIIKAINAAKKREDAAAAVPPGPPELSTSEKLLVEIRDSLKK